MQTPFELDTAASYVTVNGQRVPIEVTHDPSTYSVLIRSEQDNFKYLPLEVQYLNRVDEMKKHATRIGKTLDTLGAPVAVATMHAELAALNQRLDQLDATIKSWIDK